MCKHVQQEGISVSVLALFDWGGFKLWLVFVFVFVGGFVFEGEGFEGEV